MKEHINSVESSFTLDQHKKLLSVEEKSFWFSHRRKLILSVLEKFKNQKVSVLDVGGGNGDISLFLQKKGHDVCLLEPGESGVKNARNRGVQNVICGSIEELDKNLRFDAVICCDVLEHIQDRQKFLLQIKSHLNSDGIVMFTVPAFEFLWSEEDVKAGHFLRYNKRSLRNELDSQGLDVVFSSYLFSVFVPAILFFRKFTSLLLSKENIDKKRSAELGLHTSKVISALFIPIGLVERFLIGIGLSIPFGTSLLAIAKPQNHSK